MKSRLGIIAEDRSDVEVVTAIACKVAGRSLVIRSFVGHGCGKLRGKCRQWATDLYNQQCKMLIVIRDLDTANLLSLRGELSAALDPSPIADHLIVIAVREIEAWLLSDSSAIRKALALKKPVPTVHNPESIAKPKEKLEHMIYVTSGKTKRYLSTVHNQRIAAELDFRQVRRCRSFVPMESFLKAHTT